MKKSNLVAFMVFCASALFVSCEKETLETAKQTELTSTEEMSAFIQENDLEGYTKVMTKTKTYDLNNLSAESFGELQSILTSGSFSNYLTNAKVLYISESELTFEKMDSLNVQFTPKSELATLKASKIEMFWGLKTYTDDNYKKHLQSWSGRTKYDISNISVFKVLAQKGFDSGKRNKMTSFQAELKNFSNSFTAADPTLRLFDRADLTKKLVDYKFIPSGSNQVKPTKSVRLNVSNVGKKFNDKAESWAFLIK